MDKELSQTMDLNTQGTILYGQGKYGEALSYFDKAISEDPHYIDSYINKAQVYIMMDRFDDAEKQLRRAMLLDKKRAIIYFHLGNIDLLRGNSEAAREHYNKAISLGYDNVQIYINLAVEAEENSDYQTALSYYSRAIAQDKFNALPKARKIQILIKLRRYTEALSVCDSLIETNPDVFEGYHYKFAILSEIKKWDEAETVLDRALQLFPDDDAFFYDKARFFQAKGETEKALEIVNKKIGVNDENRAAMVAFKGELLLALGRYEEAEPILDEEYQKSHDSEVVFLLNSIAIAKKDYQKVLTCSDYILNHNEVDNYYYSALYYKALSLKKLGRTEEAVKSFEEAVKYFRAACSRTPGQLQMYFYRAMCHEELGQYDKALELSKFILDVDDSIAEVYLLRYTVFKAVGNMQAAQREFEKVKELNPELVESMEV